jgi:hypothetical protein
MATTQHLLGAETGEGDGNCSCCTRPVVTGSGEKKNNGHAGFGLFSLLLPIFFSSLSLLLCSAFFFLKAGVEQTKTTGAEASAFNQWLLLLGTTKAMAMPVLVFVHFLSFY